MGNWEDHQQMNREAFWKKGASIMESEEELFKREVREQRNREDREPVNSPPVCHDCGNLIDGEYFEYTYNDLKGKPITESYCEDCQEEFFKDFKLQGRRHSNDID